MSFNFSISYSIVIERSIGILGKFMLFYHKCFLKSKNEVKVLIAKKYKTEEEVKARREEIARQKREWRKNNPEKQQAIYDRFYAKKAGVQKEDL